MITSIDKFGRIIIPKKIRERLGINTKTTLNISENGKKLRLNPFMTKNRLSIKTAFLFLQGN